MLGVHIRLPEDSPIAALLERLEMDNATKATFLQQAGLAGLQSTLARFDSESGPDGQPWLPSKRATAAGGKTLNHTGELRSSFTWGTVDDSTVEWGTNDWHAIPLHFGATIRAVAAQFLTFRIPGIGWVKRREVTLPAREILGVNPQDELRLVAILEQLMGGRVAGVMTP